MVLDSLFSVQKLRNYFQTYYAWMAMVTYLNRKYLFLWSLCLEHAYCIIISFINYYYTGKRSKYRNVIIFSLSLEVCSIINIWCYNWLKLTWNEMRVYNSVALVFHQNNNKTRFLYIFLKPSLLFSSQSNKV